LKLESAVSQIESNGVMSSTSFSIAMNAKAFKALSSTIYQNKQGSIVRELSCNAYDSHVMAGHPEKPFEIHLPDDFEPWFSVKDFGVGLTESQITSVFSTFFESTKDQSNDVIGAFGLGAKTPFSYTDQFTVTSIVNGVKSIYSSFIGPGGFPEISKMHDEETSESNGVEIHMQVKREDFQRFRTEVREQLKFFAVKPIVRNCVGFQFNDMKPVSSFSECDLYSSGTLSDNYIVQGQVGYKLTDSDLRNINKDVMTFLKSVMQTGKRIVIKMPIGTVGVTISREAVEFDDRTLKNIEQTMNRIVDEIAAETKKSLDLIPTEFERAHWLYLNRPLGFDKLVREYCPKADGGRFELRFKNYKVKFVDYGRTRYRDHYSDYMFVDGGDRVAFVVADTKSMMVKRHEQYLSEVGSAYRVWTIHAERADKAQMQPSDYLGVVKEIQDCIPGFTKVKLASQIVVVKPKNVVKYNIAQYYTCKGNNDTKHWTREFTSLSDYDEDACYVMVERAELVNFSRDYALIARYNLASKFKQLLPLIAVRQVDETKLKKLKNLVPLHEYLDEVSSTDSGDSEGERNYRILHVKHTYRSIDSKFNDLYAHRSRINPASSLWKMFKVYEEIEKKANAVTAKDDGTLNNKAAYYGWDIPEKEIARIKARWEKIVDKMPLIKYINFWHDSDKLDAIIDYINAMKV